MNEYIEGVLIIDLEEKRDNRGAIRKFLPLPEFGVGGVGEVYFSEILPRVVKGWHVHKEMTCIYTCVKGSIILGLCDMRIDSKTYKRVMKIRLADNGTYFKAVVIPPGIWNAFQAEQETSVICNAASVYYYEGEMDRIHPDDVDDPSLKIWSKYDVAG